MGEGTKVISLADALARIEMLESQIAMLQIVVTTLEAEFDARRPSATQVAEAE